MVSEDERKHNLRANKREEEQGEDEEEEGTKVLRPARDRTRDPALFVPGTLILWSDGWFGVKGGHGGASRSPLHLFALVPLTSPVPWFSPGCLV